MATNTTPVGRSAAPVGPRHPGPRAGVDTFGRGLALDPARSRRANFIKGDALPLSTAADSHLRHRATTSGRSTWSWTRRLRPLGPTQAARRERGYATQLGIGLTSYVEITNGINEPSSARSRSRRRPARSFATGSFSHGQGHETRSRRSPPPSRAAIEKITVLKGDTDAPRGTGTYARKSTQIGGAAAGQAPEEVVEHANGWPRTNWRPSPEDMMLDRDAAPFTSRGTQPGLTWADLAGRMTERDGWPSCGRDRLPAGQPVLPVRRPPGRGRGRHRDRRVGLQRIVALDDAGRSSTRCRRRPGPRGRGRGVAPGPLRGGRRRRGRQPAERVAGQLRIPAATELPLFEPGRDGDPHAVNPLGRQGHRRVGHDRRDAASTAR